ncbi:MAG TPA: hypothetical protein VFM16_07025 [Holophagaceae bacterium]|nr:hypothetical protein [Holophagaceae bacterium]
MKPPKVIAGILAMSALTGISCVPPRETPGQVARFREIVIHGVKASFTEDHFTLFQIPARAESSMAALQLHALLAEQRPGGEVIVVGSIDSRLGAKVLARALDGAPSLDLHGIRILFVGDSRDQKTIQSKVAGTGAAFAFAAFK